MKLKHLLLIICIISLNTYSLSAQRLLGISDVNISAFTQQQGIGAQIAYEKFFGENNNKSLQVGIRSLHAKAELKGSKETVPLHDLSLVVIGRRYFNANQFYPYIGGGAFVGYETISEKDLKESILLDRKNTMLYGLQANAGAEYFLSFGSLFAETNPNYDFKLKEFHLAFNAGLKIFF